MGGKAISFQIDSTTTVACVLMVCDTHCKTLNGLVRKILLKFYKNGLVAYPEYLRGVANL